MTPPRNRCSRGLALGLLLGFVLTGCGDDERMPAPPAAEFTISPATAGIGEEFTMDASPSSDPRYATEELEVRWDLDGDEEWDAEFGYGKVAARSYDTAGTRTVRLEVRNPDGLTDSADRTLHVQGPFACTAQASDTIGTAPLTIFFTGVATGGSEVYNFDWEFGDGQGSPAQSPQHTYPNAGSYPAVLTVSEIEGDSVLVVADLCRDTLELVVLPSRDNPADLIREYLTTAYAIRDSLITRWRSIPGISSSSCRRSPMTCGRSSGR